MSECAARGCGRPAEAMLCRDHVDDLVDALRALAYGTADRVNGAVLYSDIVRRQGLYEDLVDRCYHLSKLGPQSAAGSGQRDHELWPNMRAVRLRDQVRNTITTWARDFHQANPHLRLPSTVPAAAAWMAGLPGLLAMHPAAGELCADVVPLPRRIERVVERVEGTYLGQCGGLTDDGVCDVDLYVRPDDNDLLPDTFECHDCGMEWTTAARQQHMLNAVPDQLATAHEISRALPGWLNMPVTASMIRGYAARGRLTKRPPHPDDPREDPRYRIGDVIDLVVAEARRKQDAGERRGQRKAKAS